MHQTQVQSNSKDQTATQMKQLENKQEWGGN